MISRPRLWPFVVVFVTLSALWTFIAINVYSGIPQPTNEEILDMLRIIRNGILIVLGLVVAVHGARFAWLHRADLFNNVLAGQDSPASVTGTNAPPSILTLTGQRFVLEVRGLGIVVGQDTNGEIWQDIESKANNFDSFRSANVEDYPNNADDRMTELKSALTVAFKISARNAVQFWPVPVLVWEPPIHPRNSSRAAGDIAEGRQAAGLGATLFLWQEDANTNDPVLLIEKLFEFFDQHPDVPAALLYSSDGTLIRQLLTAPSSGAVQRGQYIPPIPDSIAVMLVSRSDRVDRLMRPFVSDSGNTTAADNNKLWHYYWQKNDGQEPDDFEAFYVKHIKDPGLDDNLPPGTMQANWWHRQLPAFWKTIGNGGPGLFTPTPWLPVRWSRSQLKQFDNAPLIGYLHRPVSVRLTDERGGPLRIAQQAEALKTGWQQALDTLPDGVTPKRVFYDTTGDNQSMVPLARALADAGAAAPDLTDVHEGYDIGRRIADTGVSTTMIQLGLGLIAGYADGAASATVTRRPDGQATIIMVSPPDPAANAAREKTYYNQHPFAW